VGRWHTAVVILFSEMPAVRGRTPHPAGSSSLQHRWPGRPWLGESS